MIPNGALRGTQRNVARLGATVRAWSNKQLEAIELRLSDKPFVLCYGATGAGKTDAATAGFLDWTHDVSLRHGSRTFGLVAKTSLQTNEKVLPACLRHAAEWGWRVQKLSAKSYVIGNNRFLLLDGANVAAAQRIQGLDLAGVFIDEVNQLHIRVMQELENRVRSVDGGKIVMTANPDNPLGWFQRDYINRADDIGMQIVFLLWADNPGLPESEKRRIERTSVGAMRKRRIHGIAAPMSGTIYTDYEIGPAPPEAEAYQWFLSVDPADSSTTHALLIGKFADAFWVFDEWVWSARLRHQLTHKQQCDMIAEWLDGRTIGWAVYDNASPNFGAELFDAVGCDTYASIKGPDSVFDGIQHTMAWLANRDIKVSETCEHLITEFGTYQWDEKAAERGEDKPLKVDDHGMDALRQFCYFNHQPQVTRVFAHG